MLDQSPVQSGSGAAAMVAEVEARARRIETPCGDGHMVWRVWGEGPPVVLLHGAHGAWSHWIRNIEALSARHTVVAADMPGHGESDVPPAVEHAVIADILAEGLRQILGPGQTTALVGFSFGGVMSGHVTARHPDLVRHVVFVDPGGIDTPHGPINMHRVRGLEGQARREAQTANLLAIMLRRRESVDDLALYLQETNPPRARINPVPLVIPDKLLEPLSRITARVDAVWGEFDGPHPDPAVQEAVFRRFHPNLDFRVVPGAGHWSMFEGAEVFNRHLLELLDAGLRA